MYATNLVYTKAHLTVRKLLFTIEGSKNMPAAPFPLPFLPTDFDQPLPWKGLGKYEHLAYGALTRLDGMMIASSKPDLFWLTWLMKEAQSSNVIEGTVTTFDEILGGNAGVVVPAERRDDVQEVMNYHTAMLNGTQEIVQGRPLSLSLIKALHAILINGARGAQKTPGAFRNVQVHIGRPGEPIENASYIPPSPICVQDLLENWLLFLSRDDINPAVQAAVMHAQFEMIHPFLDGNGRMGRLLITLFLTHKGVLTKPCFYMSSYLQSHREKYYQTLGLISKDANWSPWIQFFLEGVVEHCEHNTRLLQGMTDLYERSKSSFSNETNSAFAISLLDYVFESPIFTIPGIRQKNPHISKQTVVQIVSKLQSAKIIEKISSGKGRRPAVYKFTALMNLLS